MIRIATPISDLFKNNKYAEMIENYTDCFECRDKTLHCHYDRQELFHCEIQPVHEFSGNDINYLQTVAALKNELKLVTFHMASSCREPVLSKGVFQPGGYRYSRQELLDNARKNFESIRRIFGGEIDIGVENNNYYPTDAYLHITDPDFISTIVYENDLKFLFDISHAKIAAHNRSIQYQQYIDGLPLNRTLQIHISEFGVNRNLAVDSHEVPTDRTFNEARRLLRAYRSIQYITIEYYKDIDTLLTLLQKTRNLIDELP